MGTNFYWSDKYKAWNEDSEALDYWDNNSNIQVHIGKRSAAGAYCYDCGTTLCKGGTRDIHFSDRAEWFTACPGCGKERQKEDWSTSAVGVELGFADRLPEQTGVRSCCSFTWTLLKHKTALEVLAKYIPEEKVVINEYGDTFTAGEFLTMVQQCPVQYQSPYEFS